MRLVLLFLCFNFIISFAFCQTKYSFWSIQIEGKTQFSWDWNYEDKHSESYNKGSQNLDFQGSYTINCPKWLGIMEGDVLKIGTSINESEIPDNILREMVNMTSFSSGSSTLNSRNYEFNEDLRNDFRSFTESTMISQSNAVIDKNDPGFWLKIWTKDGIFEGGASVSTRHEDVSAKGETNIVIVDWSGKKTNNFPIDEMFMQSGHEEHAMDLMQISLDEKEEKFAFEGLDAISLKMMEGLQMIRGEVKWKPMMTTLPENGGFIINSSPTVKKFSGPYNSFFIDEKEKNGNVTITLLQKVIITIKPYNPKKSKYEAFIEPVSNETNTYDHFIPKGPLLEATAADKNQMTFSNSADRGNTISFKVKVYDTETQALVPADQYQTYFQLSNVSNHQGICTNYPHLKNAPNSDPDFLFHPLMNDVANFEIFSPNKLKTLRNNGDAIVNLTSMDYGAFTNLEAEVTLHLEGGNKIMAKFKPDGRYSVRIPKDDNFNQISDFWEKQTGTLGLSAKWDEDAYPLKQRRNGDGYTLFEEYRGFVVKNNSQFNPQNTFSDRGHIRTNPNHKDVFIYDQDELFRKHYAGINPAQLNWHYVNENQFNYTRTPLNETHRWINYNTPEDFLYAKQYVMHVAIQSIEGNDGFNLGIARDSGPKLNQFNSNQPENLILRDIRKMMSRIFDKMEEPIFGKMLCSRPANFDQPLKCHYVVAINKPLIDDMCNHSVPPNYRQFVSEKLLTTTVIHEIGHCIGIKHHGDDDFTNSQGVKDCAMRYTTNDENIHPTFYSDMHRYCSQSETYPQYLPPDQILDPDKLIPIKFESKKAHGCWEQITVKSDKY